MFTDEDIRPIPLLQDVDLDFYRFASDGRGAAIDAVFDKIRNIPSVASLGDGLKSWTQRFKFGTTPRRIWRTRYRYSGSERSFAFDQVVNASPENVQQYIHCLKSAAGRKLNPVMMMTGGVGAGKSTFNKLVTTEYHDELKAAGLIVSRVEFQKLKEHLKWYAALNRLDDVLQSFVFGCIMRDVAAAIYTSQNDDEDGPPFITSTVCQLPPGVLAVGPSGELDAQALMTRILDRTQDADYCDLDITREDVQRFIRQFERYPKSGSSDRSGTVSLWSKYFLIDGKVARSSAAIAEIFVRIVLEGMKLMLIFDGFDYINVTDHRDDGPVRDILDWLARVTVNGDGQ